MILTVNERLLLLQCLPQEGSFLTLKILRQLKDKIGIDEDEHKKYGFEVKDGRIHWNGSLPQERDIEIGEKAADIVVEALRGLDKAKKLTEAHMSLYEKFIGE